MELKVGRNAVRLPRNAVNKVFNILYIWHKESCGQLRTEGIYGKRVRVSYRNNERYRKKIKTDGFFVLFFHCLRRGVK